MNKTQGKKVRHQNRMRRIEKKRIAKFARWGQGVDVSIKWLDAIL